MKVDLLAEPEEIESNREPQAAATDPFEMLRSAVAEAKEAALLLAELECKLARARINLTSVRILLGAASPELDPIFDLEKGVVEATALVLAQVEVLGEKSRAVELAQKKRQVLTATPVSEPESEIDFQLTYDEKVVLAKSRRRQVKMGQEPTYSALEEKRPPKVQLKMFEPRFRSKYAKTK